MPRICTSRLSCPVAAAVFVGVASTTARADPITVQGYTVTDLGAGSPAFSTDASGSGIVIAPGGSTAYPFPQSAGSGSSGGVLPNIPLIDPPPTYSPDTYGNPANAFAYIQSSVMNANGIAAVLEVTGVNGHWYAGDAYYVQKQTNGSWGAPVRMFSGPTDFDGSALPNQASAQQLGISIAGINNLNQVLGFVQYGPNSWQSGPFVYNINTQTSIQLGNLSGNYLNVQPIAIADNGQLLLQGQPIATGGPDHTLLLTPDGVSPEPFTTAPEPASWAVMALAAAAFALRQHRERRRMRTQGENNLAS
ncbi:MAG: hypothetical protein ACLQIB_07355 [Isosphaeraceae bacterium]